MYIAMVYRGSCQPSEKAAMLRQYLHTAVHPADVLLLMPTALTWYVCWLALGVPRPLQCRHQGLPPVLPRGTPGVPEASRGSITHIPAPGGSITGGWRGWADQRLEATPTSMPFWGVNKRLNGQGGNQ